MVAFARSDRIFHKRVTLLSRALPGGVVLGDTYAAVIARTVSSWPKAQRDRALGAVGLASADASGDRQHLREVADAYALAMANPARYLTKTICPTRRRDV